MSLFAPSRRYFLAMTLLAGASRPVIAESWPTRTITIIVPYAAGGPADAIARLLARQIGAELKQTVVVDNKVGAGGIIGIGAIVKSAADGYTLALTGPGPLAGMPNLKAMPYARTDYSYVSLVARAPAVIVASIKSGITNLPDLVAKAKAAPGKLNYGSAGSGTTPHIGAELLKQEADIDITHVPYKGAAPAVNSLLSGEIDMAMLDLPPVLPHAEAGKLKILAVASVARAPQIPNVLTTKELGFPAVLMDTNYGVIAPLGVPAEVLQRLRGAIGVALQSAEAKDQFLRQGAVATASTAEVYGQLMDSEYEKWRIVVTRGKITLE